MDSTVRFHDEKGRVLEIDARDILGGKLDTEGSWVHLPSGKYPFAVPEPKGTYDEVFVTEHTSEVVAAMHAVLDGER